MATHTGSARAESPQLLPNVTASRCWSNFSARTRAVLHVNDAHFVVLEFEHVTSVHESDSDGEIRGDWFGVIVEATLDDAIRVFAESHALSSGIVTALVAAFRRPDASIEQAADPPVPPFPVPTPPVSTGPPIHMGGSSPASAPQNVAGDVAEVGPACAGEVRPPTRPRGDEPPSNNHLPDAGDDATTAGAQQAPRRQFPCFSHQPLQDVTVIDSRRRKEGAHQCVESSQRTPQGSKTFSNLQERRKS
jgi:hypothetical protein